MNRMKNSILICLITMFSLNLNAQYGTVSGRIIDESTGEELVGAVVQIESINAGAATDIFGKFKIEKVPVGNYQLSVSYISYQSKKIDAISVALGTTATLEITLNSTPLETNTVDIVEYRLTNTEAAVLMEMQEAKGVVNGIGSAQIAKSQDRDASEVARRIPGVTVVDNRFVIVRGLSERYNAVMINNAMAPSMESDMKTFSFDIISSGLIDRLLIYKSPSADLPGEFAGGAVKVFTKNFPSKTFEVSFNQSLGYRPGTTGTSYYFSNRSATDWLGFDNGMRGLPSGFSTNVRDTQGQERLNVSKSLSNSIALNEEKAPLDARSSLYIGKKWEKECGEFGVVGAINYSRTRSFYTNNTGVYNVYDEIQNTSDTVSFMQDSTYQTNSRVGGLLNIGFRNKSHRVELKMFGSQMGQSEDLLRRGVEHEQGNYVQSNFYAYNERLITSSQLLGSHELFAHRGAFDWTFGYSTANSSDPDWRRIRYTKPLDLSNTSFQAYIPFSADPNYFGRLYMNMKETTPVAAFNYEHKILATGKDLSGVEQFITLKTGTYLENKQRVFSVRNIGYKAASFSTFMNNALPYEGIDQILDDSNINLTDGLILDEDTKPQDSYTAGNNLFAGYIMASIPMHRWEITGGARVEKNKQVLNTRDLQNKEYNIVLDSTVVLPSANISYNLSQKSLVRAAYGKTVNRPEFRELAPFAFYDYKRNAIMNGNPNLTFATITNYDIRWELYPSTSEIFSLGAFYKYFENPIELYFQPGVGSGGTLSFAPGNAPSATNYGVEIDTRIKLSHIASLLNGSDQHQKANWMSQFTIVANASLIKSSIQLSQADKETNINTSRPMMGQSPYIINTGIFYQNDSIGLIISAMYNVVGERVVIAGVPGIPEVWEMPRHLVDLTVNKSVGEHFDVRFGIQDMLNQSTVWIQDANHDGVLDRKNDQQLQSFKRGTYFTFGVTYSFKQS